jgi:hypothetical protein
MTKTLRKKKLAYACEKRQCSKCSRVLELTGQNFSKNGWNSDGTKLYFRPECKSCENWNSSGTREAKKLAGNPTRPPLGTSCDLCNKTTQLLVFDHCHETLNHRGWLCSSCNKGIGLLGDTVESLERVVLYLQKVR